jgi:4,5:9,10-diseco-3-hydroxy-5,9,17-trioxoandrosta-1(10),2-diene-4-oate hydrolase
LAPAVLYPAGVPAVQARTITIASGLRLRVLESGASSGEPVLLIHGWGASAYTYRFALEALGRAGYRALSFDLRGHGLSDKPTGAEHYHASALLDDVRGLLDAMGVRRTAIVGHSLGGGIALRFAIAQPSRVSRLALAAPVGLASVPLRSIAHLLTPRFTERFAGYLPPRWVTALLLREAYGEPDRVTDQIVDEYWAPSQFKEYYRAVRSLLDRFTWEPLPPRELMRVSQPTLVMLGTADRLIRGAERGAAVIPNVSVVTIRGAGHLGIEECAAEFNAILVRFLRGEKISVAPSAAIG